MRVCEGTGKMSGRPPPHSLLDAERKATRRGGGEGWSGGK